jgi:two-component system phosphate regulon sensor histidine kinase PhoR
LFQDISKRAQELEKRVEDRTRDIKDIQEAQRSVMLQLSHNLQTPLAILRNSLESLRDHLQPSQFKTLEHSISDTSYFITRLLRLARLESRHETIVSTTFSLSELVSDIVDETSIIATSQQLATTHSITQNINITSDPQYWRDILLNIVSNAIKYSDGLAPIQISLTKTKKYIYLRCTNSGPIIPKKDHSKIFTPFYRLDAHAHIKGTGLGLAITKQMVELLGGTLTVSSTKAKGTTFTVSFPV